MSNIQDIMSRIQKLAKERQITIKNLCKEVNVSEAGLYYSIKNNTLKVETLLKISKVLDVDARYFFTNEISEEIAKKNQELEKQIYDSARAQLKLYMENANLSKLNFKLKKRNTLIMYYIITKILKDESIKKLMIAEYINDCYDNDFLLKLNGGIHEAVLEERENFLTGTSEGSLTNDLNLNAIYNKLEQFFEENNNKN